jgi:hypothetical protein
MNSTTNDVTVKRYHYAGHKQLAAYRALILNAYNHARRLKALKGLTLP